MPQTSFCVARLPSSAGTAKIKCECSQALLLPCPVPFGANARNLFRANQKSHAMQFTRQRCHHHRRNAVPLSASPEGCQMPLLMFPLHVAAPAIKSEESAVRPMWKAHQAVPPGRWKNTCRRLTMSTVLLSGRAQLPCLDRAIFGSRVYPIRLICKYNLGSW